MFEGELKDCADTEGLSSIDFEAESSDNNVSETKVPHLSQTNEHETDPEFSSNPTPQDYMNLYRSYQNNATLNDNTDFKGFSNDEWYKLARITDKKSEILFSFCQLHKQKEIETIFAKRGGVVSLWRNSEMKGFLIYKKVFDEKLKQNVSKSGPALSIIVPMIERRDESLEKDKMPKIKTEAPLQLPVLEPLTTKRQIQLPKRYLDGETNLQRAAKRGSGYDDNLFEMGFLPPKYPKQFEYLSPKKLKTPTENSNFEFPTSGLFEISELLQSGSLDQILPLKLEIAEDTENTENREIKDEALEEETTERQQAEVEELNKLPSPNNADETQQCIMCSRCGVVLCLEIDGTAFNVVDFTCKNCVQFPAPPVIPSIGTGSTYLSSISLPGLKSTNFYQQQTSLLQGLSTPKVPKRKILLPKMPILTGKTFKIAENAKAQHSRYPTLPLLDSLQQKIEALLKGVPVEENIRLESTVVTRTEEIITVDLKDITPEP